MGLQINTNVAALNAYRNLSGTQGAMNTSLERLSSGLRINRAADDAAGLAISEKLRSQVNGLNQAQANAQDGISLIQTAEGALNEVHSILQRMRTLTVQAANGTNTEGDRDQIDKEMNQLTQELNGISSRTQFNGKTLIDGSYSGSASALSLQIGANTGQTISVDIQGTSAFNLGVATSATATTFAATFSGGTSVTFNNALASIDTAINTVSGLRANLGAVQNRLQHTVANLGVSAENLAASESRIRDTDMAKEMTSFTRSQILQQAGVSMLAQANQAPQSVLKLLG